MIVAIHNGKETVAYMEIPPSQDVSRTNLLKHVFNMCDRQFRGRHKVLIISPETQPRGFEYEFRS